MKRIIAVALACLITVPSIAVASRSTLAQTRHAASSSIAGPTFTFPVNGTAYPSNGPYVFQVQPVNGAIGYLWSFVQGGLIAYQNLAWDGHLSPASYTISMGSKAHSLIRAGDLHVWVRALMKDGTWSGTGAVMVRIQGKGGPHPKPVPTLQPKPTQQPKSTCTAGHTLYEADVNNGGLNAMQGSPDWKHLNSMLVNDGTGSGTGASPGGSQIKIPIVIPCTNYAVEYEAQFLSQPIADFNSTYYNFGIQGRINSGGQYAARVICEFCGASPQVAMIFRSPDGYGSLSQTPYTPQTGWHTYRLEMRGNDLRFVIDSSPLIDVQDNHFLEGSGAAFYSDHTQISVRRVAVIAL